MAMAREVGVGWKMDMLGREGEVDLWLGDWERGFVGERGWAVIVVRWDERPWGVGLYVEYIQMVWVCQRGAFTAIAECE